MNVSTTAEAKTETAPPPATPITGIDITAAAAGEIARQRAKRGTPRRR